MTDGLKDAHREAIIAVIAANNRVERAVLFGSRATGTNTVTSDVDIALFGDRLTLTDQARLAAAIDEIPMAQSVDLLLYNSIRDRTLREHIRSQGVAWYARPDAEGTGANTSGTEDVWPSMSLREAGVSLIDCEHRTPPASEDGYPYVGIPQVKDGRIDPNGARCIGQGHYREWTRRAKPQPFDIILSRRCNPGETGFVSPGFVEFALGQNLVLLRSDGKKVFKPFLRWLVRSPRWWAEVSKFINVGAVFDSLKCADIPGFQLPIPTPFEQRTIAHILGTLDDKIELSRRMNETMEAMAQALFKSWFVDFDPVRAKMEGRDTGLPQDIADLFPDRLVDSEMGEIPAGWEVIPLDAIARFQNGLALQKYRPAPNEARLPAVKIAQLRAGEANSGEWASATIRPECIIENGDILFSWSGSLLVKTWCGGRAALNQHLFKVTSERYPKWFYLHSLLSHLSAFQRIAQDKATTMGHIRRHHLTEALCAAPPDGLIAGLSDTFSCLLERQVATELSSLTLAVLRDTLLPKLISGEIRLAMAAKAVEAEA